MDKVALLPVARRSELFSETAARQGMTRAVAEKDFWVSWVLARLFSHPELVQRLRFKGGTSLSKAYHLIQRFSEDIDLILDWRGFSSDQDPLADRSKSRQEKLNEEIDRQVLAYIAGDLFREINALLAEHCQCSLDPSNPHNILVRYPKTFDDAYLRPDIVLEIGPLAAWLPHEVREIRSYAAESFPQIFRSPSFLVPVISAVRTFWEKATILHQEVHRPEDKPQPLGYSRHYYDLARMAQAPVRTDALALPDLLEQVVAFKQRLYPRAWARYDLAQRRTLRLVPDGTVLKSVATDYRAMRNMIFGDVPAFDGILEVLGRLETEINGSSDDHHEPG
jgi:hypothetical protein